ncbi:hypothetical protein BH09PAT2_BH09PAT2_01420 [soil metagenome]
MISIIIIVKNDVRIKKLLEKLAKIKHAEKNEIIVVDASNGALDEIKHAYTAVTWIYFSNKTNKKRTYSEQRNIGIKAASGDILVFIDADCIPDTNWLDNLLQPIYEEHENIVSGAIRPIDKNYIHKEEHHGKYRIECETMNLALTKRVVTSVGLFDESMEGCEDSDYCIRAGAKGYKIRFQPRAFIYHDWGGFMANINRSFNGGKDRATLYKKYPQMLFSFSINNIYTLFYLIYILCLSIAPYYPVYLLILFIPSIVKRRNPLKEIFNLAFSFGLIFKTTSYFVNSK